MIMDAIDVYNYCVETLKQRLDNKKRKIKSYIKMKRIIENNENGLSGLEIKHLIIQKAKLKREIYKLSEFTLEMYETEIKPYITQYASIERCEYDFELRKQIGNIQLKNKLLNQIRKISLKFVHFPHDNEITGKIKCICGEDLTDKCNMNYDMTICPICYTGCFIKLPKSIPKKDSTKQNMNTFFDRFQGSNQSKIPADVLKKIAESIIVEKPTHINIYDALSSLRFSTEYNRDVNSIGHLLYKWELPRIEHIRQKYMKFYCIIRSEYVMINKRRKSNLNLSYMGYRLFRMVDTPFHYTWFKMIADEGRIAEYDRLFNRCCENSDDKELKRAFHMECKMEKNLL